VEHPLKQMSPLLIVDRPRHVRDDRLLLRSVRISFPVLTSLCFLPGVSGGHPGGVSLTGGGCHVDTGVGVRWTPGRRLQPRC